MFTLGAMTLVMWILRFFCFRLFESPKFLLSRGRQVDAVASVHGIAYHNHTKTWLSVDVLGYIGGREDGDGGDGEQKLTFGEIIRMNLSKFSLQRIGPLFHTKKLGLTSMFTYILT